MIVNSLSFCFSENVFIDIHFWRISLLDIKFGLMLSSFYTCCSIRLLRIIVSDEILAIFLSLFSSLWCVFFPRNVFKIFSLSLVFSSSLIICLSMVLIAFMLTRVVSASWMCYLNFFMKLRKISAIIIFISFLLHFLSPLLLGLQLHLS